MIHRLTAALTIAGGTYDADAQVTLDQSWAPFVTAEVTIPLPAAGSVAALNPLQSTPQRGTLTLTQSWSEPVATLNDVSADLAGLDLDDVSALWAGLDLDHVSDLYGDRWGNPIWRPAITRQLNLHVRRCAIDYKEDTVTLTLMSDERLAQESTIIVWSFDPQTLAARFTDALSQLGADLPPAVIDLGPYASRLCPRSELGPSLGFTVWEAIEEAATSVGLRPYCNEAGVWSVVDPTAPTGDPVHLARATAADLDIDRDGEWADKVRFTTRYRLGGVDYIAAAEETFVALGDHSKEKVYERNLGDVTAEQVAWSATPWVVAARHFAAGRTLRLTAPADLAVRPGAALTTGAPSLPTLAGQVQRVTFDTAAGQMTITTRDTVTGA